MAWPSFSAVLKQFSAWSSDVPGMASRMAFTTSRSVCFSLFSNSTLHAQLLCTESVLALLALAHLTSAPSLCMLY